MDNNPQEPIRAKKDIRAPSGKNSFFNGNRWLLQGGSVLLLSDFLALAIAWQLAAYFNGFHSPLPPQLVWWVWFGIPSLFWVFAGAIILFFAYGRLYSFSTHGQNYVRAGQLVTLVYLLSLVVGYFYDPKLDPPRSLFFAAWLASVILVIAFRLFIELILRQFERTTVAVFLIAPGSRLNELAAILEKRSNYKVVGAAFSPSANAANTLQAIFDSGAIEVLVEDLPATKLASALYWQLRRKGIGLRLIPSSREMFYRRGVAEIFAGLPTLRVEAPLFIAWDYRLKRWIDILGAFFGLIFLSPLFLIVAIAIKLSSPGGVFFCQERIGLHGKPFQMWKFRTMVANAAALQANLESKNENKDGVLFKIKQDPRITPLGSFLRRTSIDELPQLLNVLLGQMSLVGPRPLPVRDVNRFDSWHHIRHQVLPGITGLWQISGRSDFDNFDDAASLDLYYIDNWSLNLDLDILVDTFRIVFFGKGAY